MKLAEVYSLSTGLKIGKQFLLEKFYPLKFEKYITIQSGSGMGAKNYDYYNEVVQLIKPLLEKNNIEIIQLGGKEDIPIFGCNYLQGQTDLHQSNFIVSRSLLHFGNDSWLAHRAGELQIPIITLYGSTTSSCHSSYKFSKAAFIESHRFGRNPSFSAQEQQKTINLIKPEVVAQKILDFLDIKENIKFETIYIGNQYNNYNQLGGFDNNNDLKEISFHEEYLKAKGFQNIKIVKMNGFLEIVPNQVVDPNKFKNFSVNIRCDFYNDDRFLFENLRHHKSTIIANSQLNLDVLKGAKPQINEIKFEINENIPIYWYKNLIKLGIKTIFFTKETTPEKIKKLREQYYDYFTFDLLKESTKEDFIKSTQEYQNIKDYQPNLNGLKFKSNKLILSNNKVYLSKAHYLSELSVNENQKDAITVIDNLSFWAEYQHFYFYT